ncbi:P-loop containing nucleoside triphosphate hydrolase protein [Thelephora terrestris]|uniref:P-loop containing nucleoside triphosphate hydrolase protein n=1 Tax=Thelephora terrestris TaxID=56493 RepID=A0A9P6HM44_9AGAM|nr:P-loop containing nucleoside triphosphate hydrolase protein [Thelephora terrestris]
MLRGAGLFTDVAEIQRDVVNQGQRNAASRFFHAMSDKDAIAAWGREIDRILHIFTAELTLNNHTILLDIRCDVRAGQGTGGGQKPAKASTPIGESPPPRPRACFGRDGLIETIVDLADSLNPVALIGAGGIGKTSVALAILHCDRVKERFGDNRRFIRCDEFPPSRADFLRRLSKVIGARVENPEGLASLRSFLSSGEMIIVLDNAESILDPEGTEGKEIYSVVEELSQFGNICLVITSRISTIPPDCETLEVPTLAMEAAHDAFYHIYKHGGRSDAVNEILRQLDFHPLSVTLLATVAHQNKWDNGRLVREWEQRQTGVLQTRHNNSLAAAIELSLASPMFKELGPDARELLGVVAFYPQGVDENNLRWLFPTTSNIDAMFDGFCVLSLSYRSNGFVTMLAPLRDYLRPVDPTRSPFLCTTKDLYIARLSINGAIGRPGHKETEWIKSEDVNVEHLLDVFTSIDANSEVIWGTCSSFITLLYLHKPRPTMLRSKIERLPDDHTSKPDCLFGLARLFGSTGNYLEHKNLLLSALAIRRKEGNDSGAAEVLLDLSRANRTLGLRQEGIQQAKEALEIFERLGLFLQRAWCLNALAYLYVDDNQLDAAQMPQLALSFGWLWGEAENSKSVGLTAFSEGYIPPRASGRGRFIISR